MQHPLLLARPADPFLRLRLADGAGVEDYVVDGDHVAFIRRGRRAEETWVSALGDDPARIRGLIEVLRVHGLDGVHVHDHIYDTLPPSLQGPDPGHWSLWELTSRSTPAVETVRLDAADPRIDRLLEHSSSAYIHAGDPDVEEWRGMTDGDDLIAVGARARSAHRRAHLVSICTDPARRGEGLGRTITASLATEALASGSTGVWLEMYADNAAAARTYQSVGFEEVGRYRSALLHGLSSPASKA